MLFDVSFRQAPVKRGVNVYSILQVQYRTMTPSASHV